MFITCILLFIVKSLTKQNATENNTNNVSEHESVSSKEVELGLLKTDNT